MPRIGLTLREPDPQLLDTAERAGAQFVKIPLAAGAAIDEVVAFLEDAAGRGLDAILILSHPPAEGLDRLVEAAAFCEVMADPTGALPDFAERIPESKLIVRVDRCEAASRWPRVCVNLGEDPRAKLAELRDLGAGPELWLELKAPGDPDELLWLLLSVSPLEGLAGVSVGPQPGMQPSELRAFFVARLLVGSRRVRQLAGSRIIGRVVEALELDAEGRRILALRTREPATVAVEVPLGRTGILRILDASGRSLEADVLFDGSVLRVQGLRVGPSPIVLVVD